LEDREFAGKGQPSALDFSNSNHYVLFLLLDRRLDAVPLLVNLHMSMW